MKSTPTWTSSGTEKLKPQRTCLACRKKTDKENLLRIARVEGGAAPDPSGKSGGRGAYICRSEACAAKALKKGLLAKNLKTAISAEAAEAILAASRDGGL